MSEKLSILIATIDSRSDQFNKLKEVLVPQCPSGVVQIVFSRDQGQANGGALIGAKRQALLNNATGDFVVFIDDDDLIPNDFVETILPHCVDGVDCIGYEINCYGYAKNPHLMEKAVVSKKYGRWSEDIDGYRYARCPHHLVPVRREYALAAGFDVSSKYGEDAGYSFRLRDSGLLKSERFIDRPMYTIRHNSQKTFGT